MAHAQKPDFVFRRNGRVHLNRRGRVQSTTGSRDVRINDSNVGYTMFRGSVKGTGYPLHSPVSPSLPLPCHHISTGVYPFYIRLVALHGQSGWMRKSHLSPPPPPLYSVPPNNANFFYPPTPRGPPFSVL